MAGRHAQEASMDGLRARIRSREVSLGLISVTSSPELVETIGHCGFDFVCIDRMATATDWDRVAHMARAARAAGLSALIRLAGNPWVTQGDYGPIAVECSRALSLAVSGVMPSVHSAGELAALLATAAGAHRQIHIVRAPERPELAPPAAPEEPPLVIPLLESQTTLQAFEEVLAVDGLEAVLIGLTDLTRMLGVPYQYEHPQVWRMVDGIAAICARRGIACGASVGHGARTPDAIAERVRRMTAHGLRLIVVSTDAGLFQFAATRILEAIRSP
jgi:4-hydroxy-2-oxoheptanedioate aldolase